MKKILLTAFFLSLLFPFVTLAYDYQTCINMGAAGVSDGACYCNSPRVWSGDGCYCPQVNQYWNGSSCITTTSSQAATMNNCGAILCEAVSSCSGSNCQGSTAKQQGYWNGSQCVCPTGYYSDEAPTAGGSSGSGSGSGSGNSGGSTNINMPTVTSTGALANPIKSESFAALIDAVVNWILNIALVLAPLVIVYGGFMYMTAAGDTNKVSQAKSVILYAVIGFIVALMAKSLINMFVKLIAK